ncbi:MAG: polyprenyl synthetase family protein [Clostridia bacterium]|nr:polyprenyl synthetase family protein [Clostridia bacterium]
MADIEKILAEDALFIEKELDRRLSPELLGNGIMADAMRYATLGGGKRIRAFLTIEFCRMFGGKPADAASYASAVEMVHAYSLIHDDMPCMDNDDMRRGKPSCHVAYGENIALLAGDTLLTYAFENAVLDYSSTDRINRYAVYEIAHGAGAVGMCGGQELDLRLDCSGYEELKNIHNLKTGALIRTAALLGYYAAVPSPDSYIRDKISAYSAAVGLAFQIIDDLLDVRSADEILGKPVGSDARNGKKTVLAFMSEEEAEAEALRLSEYAAEIFRDMPRSEVICQLPMYLYGRKK